MGAARTSDGHGRGRMVWLATRAVSGRLVYGAIVILALLLALQTTGADQLTPEEVEKAILLGTVAVAFAELYSEIVGETIKERRPLTRREKRTIARDLLMILLAPIPPLAFVIASDLGWISLRTAVWMSIWLLVGVLFLFGFVAGRTAGNSVIRSIAIAAGLLLVGLAMVGLKTLATH